MKFRWMAVLALIALSACESGPNLGVGIALNGGDVKVRPSVSGNVGGVGVAVTP